MRKVKIKSLPKAQKMGEFKPSYDFNISALENMELNRRAKAAGWNSVDEYRNANWAYNTQPSKPSKPSNLLSELTKENNSKFAVSESTNANPILPRHWTDEAGKQRSASEIKAVEADWERVHQEQLAAEKERLRKEAEEFKRKKQEFIKEQFGVDVSQLHNYEKDEHGQWIPKTERTRQLEARGDDFALGYQAAVEVDRKNNLPTVGEELVNLAKEIPFALLGTGAYSQAFRALRGARNAAPAFGALAPEIMLAEEPAAGIFESGINLSRPARSAPKPRKPSFDVQPFTEHLSIMNNPNRLKENTLEGILAKINAGDKYGRQFKSIRYTDNANKGDISLMIAKDDSGAPFFYFKANMDNPLHAGRAFSKLDEFIPKGSVIQEPQSLSLDSWSTMMRRAKSGKFAWEDAGHVPLNQSAVHRAGTFSDYVIPETMTSGYGADKYYFSNAESAQPYLDKLRGLIPKEITGVRPALGSEYFPGAVAREYQFLQVPNLRLTKLLRGGDISIPDLRRVKIGELPKAQDGTFDYFTAAKRLHDEKDRINQMRNQIIPIAISHDATSDNRPFHVRLPEDQPYCTTRACEAEREAGFPVKQVASGYKLMKELTPEQGWYPTSYDQLLPGDMAQVVRNSGFGHTMISTGDVSNMPDQWRGNADPSQKGFYWDNGSGQDFQFASPKSEDQLARWMDNVKRMNYYTYKGNLPQYEKEYSSAVNNYLHDTSEGDNGPMTPIDAIPHKKQGGELDKYQKKGQVINRNFKPSYDWRKSPQENMELNRRAELAGHNSVAEYEASGWAWQPEKTHFTQGEGQSFRKAEPKQQSYYDKHLSVSSVINEAKQRAAEQSKSSDFSNMNLKKMNQDLLSGSAIAESTRPANMFKAPLEWEGKTGSQIIAMMEEKAAYDALPEALKRRDVLTADTRSDAEKFTRRAWTAISHPIETIEAINRGYDIPSGYMGMGNPYEGYGVGSPMTSVVDMVAGTPGFIANAAYRQGEKIVDNPGEYLLTNTLGLFDPKHRGEAIGNYLDLAAVAPASRAAATPLVRSAENAYNKVATGNSFLTDLGLSAWKVERPNFAIKSSDYIPKTYTDAQAAVLDRFGKGMNLTPEQWAQMEDLTRSGATDFSKADYPISRIIGYYNRGTAENKLLEGLKVGDVFHTPTEKTIRTWSVGTPGKGDLSSFGNTRLIIPSRYTKGLGNNFAGMPYGDKRIPFIWDPKKGINSVAVGEKEIMGNIPKGFKVIGSSQENGINNLIIKPLKKQGGAVKRVKIKSLPKNWKTK